MPSSSGSADETEETDTGLDGAACECRLRRDTSAPSSKSGEGGRDSESLDEAVEAGATEKPGPLSSGPPSDKPLNLPPCIGGTKLVHFPSIFPMRYRFIRSLASAE